VPTHMPATIFAIIVAVLVLLAMIAIIGTWTSPRKASLPPFKGGYKPLPVEEARQPHPNPPKAPEGPGAASH
jgi:hypothetical protein